MIETAIIYFILIQIIDITFHNFNGMQVCGFMSVNSEDFLGIPDHSLQVTRQHHLAVARRENGAQDCAVFF